MSKTIDYLLYDNRSRASWGHDWGLKAATGALVKRQDLQQQFVDYCKLSFETGRNRLADFGWALGGFRTPDGRGYVVCVTVEVEDRAGRPTVAFLGFYCGDLPTFRWYLTEMDFHATARVILERDEPPAARMPQPRNVADGSSMELVEELRRRAPVNFLLAAFEPEKSPAAVLGYFVDCARSLPQPPSNVLGITSLIRPQELRQAGHTVVYCHPAPGNQMSHEALARHLAEQEKKPPQRWRREPHSMNEPRHEASPRQQAFPHGGIYGGVGTSRRSPLVTGAILILVMAVLLVAAWVLLRSPVQKAEEPRETDTETLPAHEDQNAETLTSDARIGSSSQAPSGTDEEYLRRVETQIHRFAELDASELAASRAHRILTEVQVTAEYQERRRSLLRDIEVRLPAARETFFYLNLAYYFDDRGKDFSIGDRAAAIRRALATAEVGDLGCRDLEIAFRFAFRSEKEPLGRWCAALADFGVLIWESREHQ